MRRTAATMALVVMLGAGLAGPVDAARPIEPHVSRLVGTVQWVTDSMPPYASWYVFDVEIHARGVKSNHTMCVKVTWPGQDPVAESGYAFPRVRPGGETSVSLNFGNIPAGAASVVVTAQLMRIGGRGCCTPVGAVRTVNATLPDPAPSVGADPVVVFDENYATP